MNVKGPVTLRMARPGDAEAIAVLHTGSWQRTYRGMMTDEFLDRRALENRRTVWLERLHAGDANQFVCVAQRDAVLVGFICAFVYQDPASDSYIDNLHVDSGMHRQGLGRALMRSAAEWLCRVAPEQGVYLWVMEANAPARAFYERLGATNTGTVEKEDPGGGRAPNCRYAWAQPHLLLMPY
jgi:ribosomal protein S18 acetylase RimI-like enzyme